MKDTDEDAKEKRKVTALLVYLAILTAYFGALIVIQVVLVYGR